MRNAILILLLLITTPIFTQTNEQKKDKEETSTSFSAEDTIKMKRYIYKLLTRLTMTYTNTLNSNQKEIMRLILTKLKAKNITNRFTQAAILSIVSKETNFTPLSEISYSNTSNARIRTIFGARVSQLSEDLLTKTKANDEAFFNLVYGGMYGSKNDEGYKYRGRGLNGVTFKGNYVAMQKYTTVDIIDNPDNLNQLDVATDVLVGYFIDAFNSKQLINYNMKNINDAKTLEDAIGAAYHANAGWGQSLAAIKADTTAGRKKAFDRGLEMLTIVDFLR